jgi:hypothetical protein
MLRLDPADSPHQYSTEIKLRGIASAIERDGYQ